MPHKSSETFRQSKTGMIILEELELARWVIKNFKLSLREMVNIIFVCFKKVIKLIKLKLI